MKIDFISEQKFIVYIYDNLIIDDVSCFKEIFKSISIKLLKNYNYKFTGFYNVVIYNNTNISILEFNNINDDYLLDFDVVVYKNSMLLFEFFDEELFNEKKIFYDNKYYVEYDSICDFFGLLEYGNIIYGNSVNEIISKGILID